MASTTSFPGVPCLPYAAIREQIQSGDILLCAGSSVFSRLIQHATNAPWSHVGFLLRLPNLDRIMVFESVESIGVRAVPMSHYIRAYNGTKAGYPGRVFVARHARFPAEAPALVAFSQGAVDLFGALYDKQEILGIAARIVAAKMGMAPGAYEEDRKFICSEYAATCFASVGLDIPFNPAGFIAPNDFATCADVTILWELELVTS
jgi:hypothetical protein